MKRKVKIALIMIIFIFITCGCISLGFYSRYNNGILVTQFGQSNDNKKASMGYMLETKENKIIMIDSGIKEYTEHIKQAILSKGGIVEAWFITNNDLEHAEAFTEMIFDGELQIKNIYVSLNSEEWYLKNENNEEQKQFMKKFVDILNHEDVRSRVHEVARREEFQFDNLNFKILKTRNPEYKLNAVSNQSVVIKVSNNFKSILFLGDIGEEYQDEFLNNNLDEINADAVQIANHGEAGVNEKVYKKISPKICFWPTSDFIWRNDLGYGENSGQYKTLETRKWIEDMGITQNYIASDGDITVRIY